MTKSHFNFLPTDEKAIVFTTIAEYLDSLSLTVLSQDTERPWGGFFVIDEQQSKQFIDEFFPNIDPFSIDRGASLTPKILIVEPGKRLSWQYHHRREELWQVVGGPIGVITGHDDVQGPVAQKEAGETVQFGTEIRHRLIGLRNWGIVAEFWQHTEPNNLSNEADIVRVEDDFLRN